MTKLSFSGHETFTCKHLWLKKGIDFISEKSNKFTDDRAVIDLGVGKNMVGSIRFWLKAFGLTDENDEIVEFAKQIFKKNGFDPYLEDIGTLWLLHYCLVKTGRASLYSLIFNEFRKTRLDFTKEQLHQFIKRYCEENSPGTYNENTIENDIKVFLSSYKKPNSDSQVDAEDDYSGILSDLELIERNEKDIERINEKSEKVERIKIEWFKIEADYRSDLPWQIVLYAILDNYPEANSIPLRELENGFNSPGSIFVLHKDGMIDKLNEIIKHSKEITFTETAGNQVLQFKKTLLKNDILNGYYNLQA